MKHLFLFAMCLLIGSALNAQTIFIREKKASSFCDPDKPAKVVAKNVIVLENGDFAAVPNETITNKIFTDTNGKIYDVFSTPTGKLFIKKYSAKTMKIYRYYLKY